MPSRLVNPVVGGLSPPATANVSGRLVPRTAPSNASCGFRSRRAESRPVPRRANSQIAQCGSYPGDAAVKAWANGGSPFSFIGFYLDAPCHSARTFTTWSGKLSLLESLGWGLAVVYVGRQVKGCGAKSLTGAIGASDGADAIAKAKAEGFRKGSIIFLDVEPFDGAVPAGMEEYVSAWLDALLADTTFGTGIYCHSKNALDLHLIGEERFAAAGLSSGAPSFWITRVKASFDPKTSVPTDCGVSFADIWQGQIDVKGVKNAGVKLDIDFNVVSLANPSKV